MKLSSITADVDARPFQVRTICGGPNLLSEAIKGTNSPPLSYLFIESVSATNVLDEAGESRLGALLKAGMAKLNAALTPGNAEDLDTLLTFQAPDGGGSKAVNDLVSQASKVEGDITQNQEWWNNLFNVFNVSDDTVKGNIINQVQQDVNTGTAPPTGGPQQQAAGDPLDDQAQDPMAGTRQAAQGEQGAQATAGAGGFPGGVSLDQLRGERDAEQSYQNDIAAQLAAIRKQREENRAEIGHLRNRLDQARAEAGVGKPAAESVCNDIALALLNEHAIQRHLNAVCSHMFHRMAANANRRDIRIPMLNEAGLGDRLRGAFNSARNFIANPEYAKRKLRGATGSANNQHAAKLAVQALTDHIRTAFEAKLQEAGMTPDQIREKMQTWMSLKKLYDQGTPSPKLMDAFIAASNEMKKIFELFQQGAAKTPFDVEEPVEAEIVQPPQGLPAPEQAVPEPESQPAEPQSPQALPEPEQTPPEPEPEPEQHPKAEFMRGAFQAMYQAALDAGRAAQGQDPTTLYNTIKAAAQKAAQPYAQQDLEATNIVYKYLVEKLKDAYRAQFHQQESFVEKLGKLLMEGMPWRRKGMKLSLIGQ